jgi:hypothetical protein
MLLVQAWQEMQNHPEQRYQVFVQHPQNWAIKGWVAVFKDDGTEASRLREEAKMARFIGIFDSRITRQEFYYECIQMCFEYRFSRTGRGACPVIYASSELSDTAVFELIRPNKIEGKRGG